MPQPEPTDVRAELATIRKLATALEELDESARARVLAYLAARFNQPSRVNPHWTEANTDA